MLSQPMAGRTEQEIIAVRNRAIAELERRGYEVVNTLFTDEWYSFQPPTNKPKSYVDPKNRSKEYVLTEEQQMAYVRLSREVYNDAVLAIITDPSYARLTDAQKAERLNAMRSSLAAEVKDRFLLWLSQNTTSTDREADKVSKETKRYIKALLGW